MQHHQYSNIAFISYKREDVAWAKWLQKKLEHYELPITIRQRNPCPEFSERPRHVFRDTTDLSGGVLAKAIKEGLDSSKFLIVICSPRAAKSEWVCKEVQDFIDSGREEYIIPFVIDGEPHAKNPENECFPDALRALADERELLGININENGRDAAAVKVVARMFDVSFDVLWQRFRREERRRKIISFSALLLITVISLVAGTYFFEQNRTIERQRERLQNDSLELSTHIKRIQRDSILLSWQKDSIETKKAELANTIEELHHTNLNLLQANQQIKEENYRTLSSQSRLLGEKISRLLDEGEVELAQKMVLELWSGKYPHSTEAEKALREVDEKNVSILHGHEKDVNSVSFSPDGKYLASGSRDKTIRVWSVDTGSCVNTLKGHEGSVVSVSFSPDGKYLISGSVDFTTRIWNTASGGCVKTQSTPEPIITVLSPDGKRIVLAVGRMYSSIEIIIFDFPSVDSILNRLRKRLKYEPLSQEQRRELGLE